LSTTYKIQNPEDIYKLLYRFRNLLWRVKLSRYHP